ncbi:MAG TPA: hypothetical protein VNG69_03870 [Casimicrobiaceae bacterium]|nr:hypothetical protein [Casimicrobiaceae bacterium]
MSKARGKRTLALIVLAVMAPAVFAYVTYYLFPRATFTNYGELLPTAPLPRVEGTLADGTPFRLAERTGRWMLIVAAPGECEARCARALYATRQARTMQGREMARVERIWLVLGGTQPAAPMLDDQPALTIVNADGSAVRSLPRGAEAIYLVDPLGNQVLAWPLDPDIKALANDLNRVLKASRIG